MDIIGASHPFFRPKPRRIAVVAVCASWVAMELYIGDPFWTIIAAGLCALAAYDLLWTYDAKYGDKLDNKDKTPDAKP